MVADRLQQRAPEHESPQPVPAVDVAPAQIAVRPVPVAGLTVGRADDPVERRADELADTALARLQRLARATEPGIAEPRTADPRATGQAEAYQVGSVATVPGVVPLDVLRRASVRRSGATPLVDAGGGPLDDATARTVAAMVGRGAALPARVRSTMGDAFGADFGSVRLHTGDVAGRLNDALGADAFTVDRTIFYGGPSADLDTDRGHHVLAHELAHVVLEPSGASARRTIRRFQINLRFEDDPPIPHARVTGLQFTGRPGDTFVGGDPQGTRRHLVSWGLEMEAFQASVQGRTMAQVANDLGCAPTKQNVEAAIKARIAGDSGERNVHQGSALGNQALQLMEQQGRAQLRRQDLTPEEITRAHVMAFMGAIDMPAVSMGAGPENDFGLLQHTVNRAAVFYATANGMGDADRDFIRDAALASLWNPQTGTYRSGDEIGAQMRGAVLATQHGLPQAAGMFGHFQVGAPQGGPQPLSGPPVMGMLTFNK